MLSLIIALAAPTAEACSPMPAFPEWSFPADASADVALNQPLQVGITNANFGDVELSVWDTNSLAPIEGSAFYTCPSDPNGWQSCLLTFRPDDGLWAENSQISWSAVPSDGFSEDDSLSGSFATTDRLSAGELPSTINIQAELIEWREIESECDDQETLLIDIELDPDVVEIGTLLQIVVEDPNFEEKDSTHLPEPLVAEQVLIREGTALDFKFDILATEEERCFTVWAISPDGLNMSQFEGPCLQWGNTSGNKGCSSSSKDPAMAFGWIGLLLTLGMRRRKA